MSKKSSFKVLAESIEFKKMNKYEPNLKKLNCRKVSLDEIKDMVKEEFGKVKDASEVEKQEVPFGDAEISKEIEWLKALDIKEFVLPKNKRGKGKKK